jgi:hypothetical protein
MTSDEELVLIFGALHLIAAALGCLLLVMFMRSEETSQWRPPSDDDESGGGGGGNDRTPAHPKGSRPPGGIPLPDAEQSRHRMRERGRLADAYRRRGRRSLPEPQRAPARRTPSRR